MKNFKHDFKKKPLNGNRRQTFSLIPEIFKIAKKEGIAYILDLTNFPDPIQPITSEWLISKDEEMKFNAIQDNIIANNTISQENLINNTKNPHKELLFPKNLATNLDIKTLKNTKN